MFDPTTGGWIAVWIILGYLIVGLITGAIVSNLVYEDGGTIKDSYIMGALCTFFWPLAWVGCVVAVIWVFGISRALTPRKHAQKVKAEEEKRKAEGKPLTASYVD